MTALDPTGAHAAALAGLPGMTPVRLTKLLDEIAPVEAWQAVRAGTHRGDPRRRFMELARTTVVAEVGEVYRRSGVAILLPRTNGYPSVLERDPGAPAVLFASGDPSAVEGRPRVAIVGTRTPTHYGLQVASEMAADLAAAGVVVVSGLALGIDGAAHAGVLRRAGASAAPPVAVAGTGLDLPYPPQNRGLWAEVASRGVVFSEAPLGTPPLPRVFPARNRIIAALSDVVVVVESQRRGGCLYTAEAAARRSIPVCAVPGSVRSRASDGANGLLVDGCTPVRDATDVLVAVALARAGRDEPFSPTINEPASPRPEEGRHRALSTIHRAVLGAVDDTPTGFETILIRADLSIAPAAQACDELVELGLLRAGAGWWSKA
jgi:DNA processing protein